MDDNTKNTQASAQQDGQQNSQNGTQQPEKLFTQADVDRIINNRFARMKQDMDTAEQYRQERDDARRELEQYKNDAFLASKGVGEQYRGYVAFEVSKLVDDKTDFQKAAEKFLDSNPFYTGRGYTVVSTGTPDGGPGTGTGSGSRYGSAVADADIRKAMGLKG